MVDTHSIIVGGKVVNRIVSTRAFAEALARSVGGRVTNSPEAQKGFLESEGGFTRPQDEPSPADPVVSLLDRLVLKGVITDKDKAEILGQSPTT